MRNITHLMHTQTQPNNTHESNHLIKR